MASPKPEQIQWLEKQLGAPLHPLRSGNVADWENRTCYELDADGQITGLNLEDFRITDYSSVGRFPKLTTLNLYNNKITDWSFLKGMNQLTSLHLSNNKITDTSFLKGMNQLTSLDLNNNKITDWSFLKEMNQLTSLDLNNTITDTSFLKGMNQLTSLNLYNSKITDWSHLKGMNQLTSLDLGSNTITDASFMKGMNQLTSLNLYNNKITDWSFLKGMNQLTSLNLSNNKITDASFLKGMNQLTTLNLYNNKITDTSFLKAMNQLASLDLSYNNITDWSFLKEMNQLTSLNLGSNNITDWSFLKEMNQLTSLNLSHNNITDASFLKGMNQLTKLHLYNNKITDWSFLKGMNQLTTLNLGSNNITDASFMKGMNQLTTLNLSRNNISDTSFLKGMNQLTTLNLGENQIEKLPSELFEWGLEIRTDEYIARPYSLNVGGNPLQEPPLEIVNQGHAAIMAWHRSSLEGEIDINEVKIILVGDGSAGKTTVRKRLMGQSGNPTESVTDGIEIHDHKIECHGRTILAHFWDFGGQEIMHATHQFFLSKRSLYVLVLDGRKEEDADYWLKHIESFGGNSPILVCLNKIDQHPGFEVDRKNLKTKYPGIIDFYRLKCLDDQDAGVKQLIADLPRHISQVEMAQSKWPRKWSNVKERLQADNKPFIDQNEFSQICNQEKIEDPSQRHTLIRFLNDLGIALHFDERRLKLVQILNPRWATQAVYRIINNQGLATAHGVLDLDQLAEILVRRKPDDFEYPTEKLDYIVELMMKFELCHELGHDRVLLPDLLCVQEPAFSFSNRDLLRFRLQYDYLPTSILTRMIVKMHTDTNGDHCWRTGVVLKKKDGRARAIIRSDRHERRITIEVEGVARRDYFAEIKGHFDRIHAEFQKLEVKEQVPLPDHPDVVVDYVDLLFHEEKKRKTILVGKLNKEYDVQKLLNGIEPKEKRQARKQPNKHGDVYNIETLIAGSVMGDVIKAKVGDNTSGTIIIGKNINSVTAEKIENSFNTAGNATDRSKEIRDLLQSLAQEMAKIAEKLPAPKAEEAADNLERITEESIKEKPKKSYWELSKNGIIEAAEAVGVVGETAIKLVTKLGPLLGF